MATFTDALRERDDEALVMLFTLRPDLASPSPGHLVSLAARACNASSQQRALSTLNTRTIECLEAVVVLTSLDIPATHEAISQSILGTTSSSSEQNLLDEDIRVLVASALLWQDDSVFRLAPGLEDAFSGFVAGFGPLSHNRVACDPLPSTAPSHAADVLDTIVWGPPVARVPSHLLSTRPHAEFSPTHEALRWLLLNHYVELLDSTHVYVPRQTAFALRGNRTHVGLSVPPADAVVEFLDEEVVKVEAAGAAQNIVRLVTELISLWELEPAARLRNGGLPVRELKRVANELDVSLDVAVRVCEFAYAARLVRAADAVGKDFAPTDLADDWLQLDVPGRWSVLVQGWLASQRQPWRTGQLDEKSATINALHPDMHEAWVPRLRGSIIALLKRHPLMAFSEDLVSQELAWHAPRAVQRPDAVAGLLFEAALLGVTGSGALLPGADSLPLHDALTAALPDPVSEIFIQGDLTGMVPGRPSALLDSLLEECATVESRGGAVTVRFTPESITHAFDNGYSAQELTDELSTYSVTPLPQPLMYLIRDTERRHGVIRVGALASYVRTADEATCAAILSVPAFASLGLFELAPTVLGSSAPISQVLTMLREAGFAPAVEGPDGALITADRQSPKVRILTRELRAAVDSYAGVARSFAGEEALIQAGFSSTKRGMSTQPTQHFVEVVRELRAAEVPEVSTSGTAAFPSSRSSSDSRSASPSPVADDEPSLSVLTLREAISDGALVSVALADARGALMHRVLKPLRYESGRLRALDPERESELTVAIHRIASVTRVSSSH
ncbi:helicase-associated domain-containing protein [Timonella sp. A28]|uniref:helicase-associated domain-containing protein n=1 Tax=Timonella sp. A28 TaxID=3442640 RepID=UPI003EC0F12C